MTGDPFGPRRGARMTRILTVTASPESRCGWTLRLLCRVALHLSGLRSDVPAAPAVHSAIGPSTGPAAPGRACHGPPAARRESEAGARGSGRPARIRAELPDRDGGGPR